MSTKTALSDKKEFSVLIFLANNEGQMRIDNVKECSNSENVLYVYTKDETYIFPLCNLKYARLVK